MLKVLFILDSSLWQSLLCGNMPTQDYFHLVLYSKMCCAFLNSVPLTFAQLVENCWISSANISRWCQLGASLMKADVGSNADVLLEMCFRGKKQVKHNHNFYIQLRMQGQFSFHPDFSVTFSDCTLNYMWVAYLLNNMNAQIEVGFNFKSLF